MEFKVFVFWVLAVVLVGAAFRVITAKNTVHAALYLVLAFFNAAGIWMLLPLCAPLNGGIVLQVLKRRALHHEVKNFGRLSMKAADEFDNACPRLIFKPLRDQSHFSPATQSESGDKIVLNRSVTEAE